MAHPLIDQIKVTILGSGASTGTPLIGCRCPVCLLSHPKNRRLRSSLLIQWSGAEGEVNLVIDTSPDFRQQMLNFEITKLAGVIYTHAHADHCHGIDDLRAYSMTGQKAVNCYATTRHQNELKKRFDYLVGGKEKDSDQVILHTIKGGRPFEVAGLTLTPYLLPHGPTQSVGLVIKDFAYFTDFIRVPKSVMERLENQITTMVVSGPQLTPLPTHLALPQSVELLQKIGVKRGVVTHLSHQIDYFRQSQGLPENIVLAYDGLKIQHSFSSSFKKSA